MKLVAGNWKMNGSPGASDALVAALLERQQATPAAAAVVLCPPAHLLQRVGEALAGTVLQLGAQDCSNEAGPGAFTGEISAAMLQRIGCGYVILGHSERRQRHGESDALVAAKAEQALAAGLIPIVCVGESLAQREAGEAESVVRRQVAQSLPAAAAARLVVLAYEPIWAIGTGRTATPEDVAAMHAAIGQELAGRAANAPRVPILYGGSVKPDNAASLLSTAGVDGALVGGASLKAEDFWGIVSACPG